MSKIRIAAFFMALIVVMSGIYISNNNAAANNQSDLSAAESSAVEYFPETNNDISDMEQQLAEIPEMEDKRLNILLLGIDAREGWETARSDVMMLASIDPQLGKVAVISIPRDTRTDIKGRGIDKICTANFVGGPERASAAVENLLDIQIDSYVEIDFKGFTSIIDKLGGVTVNVPQRMCVPAENIDISAGEQILNGEQALGFVRFRGYPQGDIARTDQQQKFIKVLADEILKVKNIIKIPSLIEESRDYVDTNINFSDIMKIAKWGMNLDENAIITQTLPGYYYDKRDADGQLVQSFWVSTADGDELLEQLFIGEKTPVIARTSVIEYEELEAQPGDEIKDIENAGNDDEEDMENVNRDEQNDEILINQEMPDVVVDVDSDADEIAVDEELVEAKVEDDADEAADIAEDKADEDTDGKSVDNVEASDYIETIN